MERKPWFNIFTHSYRYFIGSVKKMNAFCRKIRNNHEGMLDCKDLLKANAQRGGEKKPHCDGMVYEAVEAVCEILRENGKLA